MEQPLRTGLPPRAAPSFYLTDRQPIRPGAIVLAIAVAAGALYAVAFGLGHSKGRHFRGGDTAASRAPGSSTGDATPADDEDDPDQIDTIVLGDAADAPRPAHRSDRISDVHATIIVRLPRFGEQVGLIPDNPAGHLLYGWLAAFNQASDPSLQKALPNVAPASTTAAELEMRQQNGGFSLLSAKEIQPGVLVFRLRDQSPSATEVLGTLHVRPNSNPAAIASFSLRAIAPVSRDSKAATQAQ